MDIIWFSGELIVCLRVCEWQCAAGGYAVPLVLDSILVHTPAPHLVQISAQHPVDTHNRSSYQLVAGHIMHCFIQIDHGAQVLRACAACCIASRRCIYEQCDRNHGGAAGDGTGCASRYIFVVSFRIISGS